ncbi:MAG: response regulator transcription factor [Microbacteriaceae bacterium]|nr:response regulator transcription factor [Cryobacterium sp.]MBX3103385.1 response regulator transcription factor [Cryobacterium sp.]MCC6376495.1 response regulator transcription factor [Microbacteriaceae bacterium]
MIRTDGGKIRVLVVDDEQSLSDLLSMALKYEGWEVRTANTGHDAISLANAFQPDLVVLDIMLPDIDGLDVLSRLRGNGHSGPVLFLTAKDSIRDRITGLTATGDDYVTKPFSLEELVARLRGLLRRSRLAMSAVEDPEVLVGDLRLNEESYEVSRGDKQITLTATEFELLRYLMRNPKRVLTKDQILDHVWSYDFEGRASVVELYISYLRKKIDSLGPAMIHTVRGVGYMIKASQ